MKAAVRTLDVAGEWDAKDQLLVRVRLEPLVFLRPLVPRPDHHLALLAILRVQRDDLVPVDVLEEKVQLSLEQDVGVRVPALAARRVRWSHSTRQSADKRREKRSRRCGEGQDSRLGDDASSA